MKMRLLAFLLVIHILLTAQEYKLEGDDVKIEKLVFFESGPAKLNPVSTVALGIIKKYLDDKSYICLLSVECHTDNTNDENANQALSEQTVMADCKALIKLSVDCKGF